MADIGPIPHHTARRAGGAVNGPGWMRRAACAAACDAGVDPELWHPKDTRQAPQIRLATQWCDVCEVQAECLSFATTNRVVGVWGGRVFPLRMAAR